MHKTTSRLRAATGLAAGVILGWWLAAGLQSVASSPSKDEGDRLPRFTEEHEVAALHFVKKHLPELLPVLEELKKSSPTQYQREIRELYHDAEALNDLSDDAARHELELAIWKTENKAHLFVARLSTPSEAKRKEMSARIEQLARELVNLDLKVLELKAEQLDKELGEVKDEIAKITDGKDRIVQERFKALLEKARRPRN